MRSDFAANLASVFTLYGIFLKLRKGDLMPRVSLNQKAPNFTLPDFSGKDFTLDDLKGQKNVLLVFNRTFA